MGLKFRKSINLGGGFRVNLSKSGVGYSWGVPGYRITKTANGKTRKTYSIPGTGISYVDEKSKRNVTQNKNTKDVYIPNSSINRIENIESASIEQFQHAEYRELTEKISQIIKLNTLSNVLLWCIFLVGMPPFFLLPLIGVILKIILHTNEKIDLQYTIDDDLAYKYGNKIEQWMK
jgi:hypothetical protein